MKLKNLSDKEVNDILETYSLENDEYDFSLKEVDRACKMILIYASKKFLNKKDLEMYLRENIDKKIVLSVVRNEKRFAPPSSSPNPESKLDSFTLKLK